MANQGLTEEQKVVFSSFCAGANLYITGKGGTGKSYLTRYIIDWCGRHGKTVLTCAPTGIAALNVGGSTIHRVFGAPTSIIEPGKRCYNKRKLEVIGKADVVIIDEISMCRIDLFEYVANTLLSISPRKQLLVVGDFFQLPPVLTDDDAPTFRKVYGNRLFAFESPLWDSLQLQTMELTTSMRQKDKKFISALDSIRGGKPDFSVFGESKSTDPTAVTLCGTNHQAEVINHKQLLGLRKNGSSVIRKKAIITGDVKPGEYPTDETLSVAVGARVVMLSNDFDGRWVNGSFATVSVAGEDTLAVRIEDSGEECEVERKKWTFLDYEAETKDGKTKLRTIERGSFEQYPMRLAWAITIHKSQGQTYSRVNIDVGNIFAEGQLYVALSRCKTLAGMKVIGKLTPEKVIVSDAVVRFMAGDHKPTRQGPMLDFTESGPASGDSDRYQEGYDDGYRDGENDTEAKYQERVKNDPAVNVVSDYTRRQRELAKIKDPQVRNPKGAGRKKKEYNQRVESKAIRVLGEIADDIKSINEKLKEDPEKVTSVKAALREILDSF